MNLKHKLALGALMAILACASASVWYYRFHERQRAEGALESPIPAATSTPTSSTPANGKPAGSAPAPAPAAAANKSVGRNVSTLALSYNQALNIYSRTRVRFDASCRMQPATPAFGNGVTVMFDNRYRDGRYFQLDGSRYYLPGYGFKLLKLTAKELPHGIQVVCGETEDAGKITLQ